MRIVLLLLLSPLALAAVVCTAAPAHADVLELKDGRLVEGMVFREDGDYLVLSRFGPRTIKADEVSKHTKAKSVDAQVRERLATLPESDTKNRVLLAAWLHKLGREAEARSLADAVLAIDPEHAGAHALLGHERFRGRWMTPDAAKCAQGLEQHGDKWYTPAEWKNVSGADRKKAAALEQRRARETLGRDVNRMLRLVTSPDDAVRARAKKRLASLAEELNSDPLRKLVANLDAYVRQLDDLRTKAAAISSGGSMAGHVMGEFRATVARLKRPIRSFTTNLASGPIGANAPVTLQLPELEVIKVRTTGIVPVVGP